MGQVHGTVTINAPTETVWQTLADLGSVSEWDPSVVRSCYISDAKTGVGAARHCDIKHGHLKERIIEWSEGRAYKIEVFESKGVPFKSLVAEFAVRPDQGATVVTQSIAYTMKGGIFAPLLGLIAGGIIKNAQRETLRGLREFTEGGNRSGSAKK